MKDFLSIREFSEFSGIETSTLRYWDNIGLFSPIKRSTENNYRYYSPEQIISVNFIKVMSSLNVPLKAIGEMQKERNPAKIVKFIEQQQKLLDMEMQRLRECYSIIHTRGELIQYGMHLETGFKIVDGSGPSVRGQAEKEIWVDETEISVLYEEDKLLVLGPPNEWVEGEGFYEPFKKFCDQADKLRINLNFPIGGLHESTEIFLKKPECPDNFFTIDPMGNYKRPAGYYLTGFARGYYGEVKNLAKRMEEYIKENSLKTFGPVFTIYLHDEVCIKDPDRYLAQVTVAVSK